LGKSDDTAIYRSVRGCCENLQCCQ